MNNWAIKYTTEYPDETVAADWNDVSRAASQFVRGIKSSLNHQGVTWSGLIPFDFSSQVPGGGPCVKKEWVTFNLQLFDSNRPKNRTRTAALDISKLNLNLLEILFNTFIVQSTISGPIPSPFKAKIFINNYLPSNLGFSLLRNAFIPT